MDQLTHYAHTREGQPETTWHRLDDHLEATARRAATFAEAFDAQDWAYLAGLWHDIGKYRPDFQRRLRGEHISAEHAGAGAVLANSRGRNGITLAFVIAAHHTGLANRITSGPSLPTPLQERLSKNESIWAALQPVVPNEIWDRPLPPLPERLQGKDKELAGEFWIRFLFSALVDADWLDTEAFLEPERASARVGYAGIPELRQRLDAYIDDKVAGLSEEDRQRPVNQVRAEILAACRKASQLLPGLYSLTAPTGGGKTLASMSFALRHAEQHGLWRVIVVIPYTSIIEQNAREYGRALGESNVVEHHSNLDLDAAQQRTEPEAFVRHMLATENWDAPVIVTTSVQFFESLLSNRRGPCRKLHNIARSVIVFDEVQALPPEFLTPILSVLRELREGYGCTLLFSTATPPALAKRPALQSGLEGVREILEDPHRLSAALTRVDYEWRVDEPVSWEALGQEVAEQDQVLVITHKRNDARELAQVVSSRAEPGSVFHLSALMCPAHRLDTLAAIRERLAQGWPCIVVSTQLVEAGVDLDFPVVYRALGGLDGIVQAAGRCNREGRAARGRVIIYRAPTDPPGGTPRRGRECTESILVETGASPDLSNPDIFETYFRMLYHVSQTDIKGIQANRREFNFATVGHDFKLIEDGFTHPIIVPYGKAPELAAKAYETPEDRTVLRKLQPYLVQIYERQRNAFLSEGAIEEVLPGLYALSPVHKDYYHLVYGLEPPGTVLPNPEALIG